MVTSPSSPPLDEFTTAILTLLRGQAPEKGARWVYDAGYDGNPLKPAYPHAILYRVPGGSSDVNPSTTFASRLLRCHYATRGARFGQGRVHNKFQRRRSGTRTINRERSFSAVSLQRNYQVERKGCNSTIVRACQSLWLTS